MKNKIVHIVSQFPSKSETFIINTITQAITKGFSAQILAHQIVGIENSSQKELLKRNNLYDNAKAVTPKMPQHKIKRVVVAFLLLLKNPLKCPYFFKALNVKKYGKRATSLKLWYQVANFSAFKKGTIFHAHFGDNGILLAELKQMGLLKGKLMVSFYGYDTFATKQNRINKQKQFALLFKMADVIFVNSNYLKQNLLLLNAPLAKIKMVHVGVDVDLFNNNEQKHNSIFSMVTVGRLIHLKGQYLGVEVVAELKKRGHQVQYTIIGDGEEMDILHSKIETLHLQKEVHLVGAKNQSEIIEFFKKSHLFLMTSITDVDGRAEGQGLVTAEAQAMGLPVIGFNSGGVSETIDNNKTGFIVLEKDIVEMADKIELLIQSPNLLSEMSTNARTFVVKQFNNKIQAQKIIDYYG